MPKTKARQPENPKPRVPKPGNHNNEPDPACPRMETAECTVCQKETLAEVRRVAAIVESSDDAILSKTLEGVITSWNKGAERLYGYAASEAIGRPMTLVVPPELHDELKDMLQSVARGERIEHHDTVRIRKDGSRAFVSVTISPLRNAEGQITGASAIVRDITDRKRAEEELRQSELRYRTLFTEMMGAFALMEVIYGENGQPYDYRYLALNPAFETVSGQSKDVIGKTLREVLPDLDPFWFEIYGRVAATGQSVHVERYVEAISRWVDASAFRACEGQVGITFANITERKQAEAQVLRLQSELEQRVIQRTAALEAANKELEAFTYSVSHDLRAPLRHIAGFAKILSEDFSANLPPQAQHHLQRIQEGTRHMGELTDDLLNLGRVGRRALSVRMAALRSVVNNVIDRLQPDVGDRHVEWKIGDLPYVECDTSLMEQVFQNLLANALKFTRTRAHALIEIGLEQRDGQSIVFVRDNGVGFSMKYADKLFGVFQRLHRAEDFEGTGIGLVIAQRIVHKHGGQIWAEAELDKGACFYFTLGSSQPSAEKSNAMVAGANP